MLHGDSLSASRPLFVLAERGSFRLWCQQCARTNAEECTDHYDDTRQARRSQIFGLTLTTTTRSRSLALAWVARSHPVEDRRPSSHERYASDRRHAGPDHDRHSARHHHRGWWPHRARRLVHGRSRWSEHRRARHLHLLLLGARPPSGRLGRQGHRVLTPPGSVNVPNPLVCIPAEWRRPCPREPAEEAHPAGRVGGKNPRCLVG